MNLKLSWYINRLKLMSFKEIFFFRIPQQIQYKFFGKIQKYTVFNSKGININPKFEVNKYSELTVNNLISGNENVNKYEFFQSKIDLSENINWLKDYKNNITSSEKYYANIKRQNYSEFGDVKYVCEPSRFYFLPFLALYNYYSKGEEQVILIERILNDWINQNPYLRTIHWTSGIEIGIRSINLIYTHIVLSQQEKLTKSIDDAIRILIQYNYQFLKNHLSMYSSANNHLVAELAGLVVITSYFDSNIYNASRNKWQNMLFNEIENQVNEDGVNMELSTHYHAEVTDHFFNALQFIKNSGDTIPSKIESKFKKMFNFLSHVEYNGNKTVFGDNDEGYLLFPYFSKKFSIYRSLLQSSNLEYNSGFNSNNYLDLRNYLIYGEKNNEIKSIENPNSDEVFKSSGYAFLYNNCTKLSIDFGAIGDNVSAAHGHSDIFHFTLESYGVPILIDPGTYQYHNIHKNWREYYRGVSAHNTISINGLNQATSNSRMSWINLPKVDLLKHKINSKNSFISCVHNAYKNEGIIHKREFEFLKKENIIIIKDILTSSNDIEKTLTFYLNFNPELELIHNESIISMRINKNQISIENQYFNLGKIIRGNEEKMLGWYSKKYDLNEEGQTFIFSKTIRESITLETKINFL